MHMHKAEGGDNRSSRLYSLEGSDRDTLSALHVFSTKINSEEKSV